MARTINEPAIEAAGTQVGPYKLLEQIGEGGFGIVFMADQQAPVRRRVALKIIKPGMDTRKVLARFEAERHALALMDHPNIARALDAGATDSGRPYFVMELVRGVPITDYCDRNNLAVHERLDLFVNVCRAVQHAHQKGIIHRDIKPSNVLVTMQDGRPVPKMIDFGVAKAINQQLTQDTLFTRFAEMIGTPLYMSPEQAEMTSLDIDTRSDIYSLGVLLYELLTGTTPCDKNRLKQAAYDEIRRIIREEEPAKPSIRISTLGDKSAAVATHRHADPHRLSQLVRGDLDWIVMKALEKDRTRRYETASGLAMDVERHLDDEPVLACPPSTAYRFAKFARRNRVALATSIVMSGPGVLELWDVPTSTRIRHRPWPTKNPPFATAICRGARTDSAGSRTLWIAIADSDSTITPLSPNDFIELGRLRLTGGPYHTFSLASDVNGRLYALGFNKLFTWEDPLRTDASPVITDVVGSAFLAATPDGNVLAFVNQGGQVGQAPALQFLVNGVVRQSTTLEKSPVSDVRFLGAGQMLVARSDDSIVVFSWPGEDVLAKCKGAYVCALADVWVDRLRARRRFVAASIDGSLREYGLNRPAFMYWFLAPGLFVTIALVSKAALAAGARPASRSVALQRPLRFSGDEKGEFCKRLGPDWTKLAEYLEIPNSDRSRFPEGEEPRAIREWLNRRNRLSELKMALERIDRSDLARELEKGSSAMSLAGQQFKDLQEALVSAFDYDSLAQMVRLGLGQTLESIVVKGAMNRVVFELIGWAERQGRVAELIRAAASEIPGNPKLTSFVAKNGALLGDDDPAVHTPGPQAPPKQLQHETSIKTVLEIDMVGYSSIARTLEQNIDAKAVGALNAQIQGFVDAGLRAIGLRRPDVVRATTGDGAILVFDRAEQAHRFAAATHSAARAHNAGRETLAMRRFRMGAATGEIMLKKREDGYDMAGVTIANAVRLEAASRPGNLLVDLATYEALPRDLQAAYGREEAIPGKRDEVFRARRCVMDPDADEAGPVSTIPTLPNVQLRGGDDRREIVLLMAKLYPPGKLDALMFLLEMPLGAQPSRSLTDDERKAMILQWAQSPAGPGLSRLASELRYLIGTQ